MKRTFTKQKNTDVEKKYFPGVIYFLLFLFFILKRVYCSCFSIPGIRYTPGILKREQHTKNYRAINLCIQHLITTTKHLTLFLKSRKGQPKVARHFSSGKCCDAPSGRPVGTIEKWNYRKRIQSSLQDDRGEMHSKPAELTGYYQKSLTGLIWNTLFLRHRVTQSFWVIPKLIIWTACLVLFVQNVSFGAEKPILRVMQHIAMNADVELVMYGDPDMDPEALVEVGRAVFDAIDRLESRISRWKADSYTSLVNRAASKQPVVVAQELMDILLDAKHFYETTDGVFDVTVGPLLERWGFYTKKGGAVPTPEELAQIKEHIGFNHVILDPMKRTVFFDQPDMRIDFGGIGKGLALDYGAAILRENGIKSARMHIGTSTIITIGAPPGKSCWTVDIRSPYNTGEDTYIARINIRDESLSTSGDSERFVEIDGRRYGHIIDPRTGMPAEGVLSATAIAPKGLDSDALSTSFFILGIEGTRKYCELHPEVRAMLVVEKDDALETIFINFNNHKE